MVITWDENKASSNITRHGISFREAQSVLFAAEAVTIEDRGHSEDRFITIAFFYKAELIGSRLCSQARG